MKFHAVFLICALAFYFSILVKGQPNVGYSQCETMRQGFFNHYYCTLQCFGEVLHLSSIKSNLCEGTVHLSSSTKEPVPLPVVVQVIECITVRCKSAAPPSVCGGCKEYNNIPDIDFDDPPSDADDYQNNENKDNKDFIAEETSRRNTKSFGTATAQGDNTNKKSNNYYYDDADFYYDEFYYDDSYYYDHYKNDHSDKGKDISDEKKISPLDSTKDSAQVTEIKKSYSDESIKQEDYIEPSIQTIVLEKSKENPTKEENIQEKFNENITKEKNVVEKSEEDSTKQENVDKFVQESQIESIVEKSEKDSIQEESIEKSNKDSEKTESLLEKSNQDSIKKESGDKLSVTDSSKEDIKKSSKESLNEDSIPNTDSANEKGIDDKSDVDSLKEEHVDESNEKLTKEDSDVIEDSTKEEIIEKKSNVYSSKEKNIEETFKEPIKEESVVDEDSTNEKIFDEKSDVVLLKEKDVEKSEEESIKEKSVVDEDSTSKKNFDEKSDVGLSKEKENDKSNDELTKDESVVNKDLTKEKSFEEKSDGGSLKEKDVEQFKNESTKEESVLYSPNEKKLDEKSGNDSSKEKNIEKSTDKPAEEKSVNDKQSTKQETVDEKINAHSSKDENIKITNEDSIKEDSVVQKSDLDSAMEDTDVNEKYIKEDKVVEKSSKDSSKATNNYSEISLQNLSEVNTKHILSSDVKEGFMSTAATEDSLQLKNEENKPSSVSESVISNSKGESESYNSGKEASLSSLNHLSKINNKYEGHDDYYYYYLSLDDDDDDDDDDDYNDEYGFSTAAADKKGYTDSNQNKNMNYQINTENKNPSYDTKLDKSIVNSQQPPKLNYPPTSHSESKSFSFEENDNNKDSNSKSITHINSESGPKSKTDEFSASNANEKNSYQFSDDQKPVESNYPTLNNARNSNDQNNNAELSFQPAAPSKPQYFIGQNPQYLNLPYNTQAADQVNSGIGMQNFPPAPPVFPQPFVPYPYRNMDYNIKSQPGFNDQHWKSFGIPNQQNSWNIQPPQNPELTPKAPSIFWNPNSQTQNQQVFPPNNAQFMNNGPSNLPIQNNMNTRIASSDMYGKLPPRNLQPAPPVISQFPPWNMPYPPPPPFGPVNYPPVVKNAFGMQTYQGQPLGNDKGLPFERVNDDSKIKFPAEVINFNPYESFKALQNN